MHEATERLAGELAEEARLARVTGRLRDAAQQLAGADPARARLQGDNSLAGPLSSKPLAILPTIGPQCIVT